MSPSGSDAAAGTQLAPWKSVAKVNAASLAPGDIVRFAGGATWNAMLAPAASGTTAAPIVFSTYGAGRAVLDGAGATGYAGIAVTNRSSLVFEHLAIRHWTGDGQGVYLVGARSVRFTDVVVETRPRASTVAVGTLDRRTIEAFRVSRIAGAAGSGVGINVTTGSSGFHVTDTVLEHVADSCVIDQGADSLYERVTVTDCGFGGITYGTHGLYLKGPRQTLRDSTVSGAYSNCISVRYQDATITGNTVSNCPIGIAYFDSSSAAGTVTLLRNRVSDTGTGIYIDSAPTQNFRISQNTIVGGRRSGATTEGIVSNNALRLAITNNIVPAASARSSTSPAPPRRPTRSAATRSRRAPPTPGTAASSPPTPPSQGSAARAPPTRPSTRTSSRPARPPPTSSSPRPRRSATPASPTRPAWRSASAATAPQTTTAAPLPSRAPSSSAPPRAASSRTAATRSTTSRIRPPTSPPRSAARPPRSPGAPRQPATSARSW